MSHQIREYQSELVEKIHESFKENKSLLLQMPTGTGKTVVFCKLIHDYLETYPRKRIFVLVHRKELLAQTQRRLYEDYNLPSGKIESGKDIDINFRIHVCMVQTLVNIKFESMDYFPSLLIIDEAHHTASHTYKRILDYIVGQDTKILGVTATPSRLDGKFLCFYFDDILISNSIKWFIKEKYLSKIKYYGVENIFLTNIRTNKLTLDYEEKDLDKLMSSNVIMKDVIAAYKTFAINKKTLIFAVNQNHSTNIKNRLESEKFESEIVDSNTSKDDRESIINRFRNNEIKILINVQIFTEGFDCPDIEAVILARPTKSLTLYLQMIGRVTRNPAYPEQNTGIVLDNAGIWKELGLPTQDFNWNFEFNPGGVFGGKNGEWLPIPMPINLTKIGKKQPKTPIEFKHLKMKELFIGGDESYDSSENEIASIQISNTTTLNSPIGLYEIEDNLFFQVDSMLHIFYVNNGHNKILTRPYFFSLIEFRKYIVMRSVEFAQKIKPIRNQHNQDIVLHLLPDITKIQDNLNISLNKISRERIINHSVSDDDLQGRIFLWLWKTLF